LKRLLLHTVPHWSFILINSRASVCWYLVLLLYRRTHYLWSWSNGHIHLDYQQYSGNILIILTSHACASAAGACVWYDHHQQAYPSLQVNNVVSKIDASYTIVVSHIIGTVNRFGLPRYGYWYRWSYISYYIYNGRSAMITYYSYINQQRAIVYTIGSGLFGWMLH